ncbi:hypothetical protein [Flavipsychrobacter stenotrophus]|nr:hypothetical protein [Flavipsychrobacter stenotrophus]
MNSNVKQTSKGSFATSIEVTVPPRMTALVTNTSVDLVNKVRAGKRGTGEKAKRVTLADDLLQEGMSKLMNDVKAKVNK